MKRKVESIILLMLLITASLPVMTFIEPNTLADSGGGSEDDGYLDFDYYVDTVSYLSNIIHDESVYGQWEIKKGRYFGSDGDKDAADYLRLSFIRDCEFHESNVNKIQLKNILGTTHDYSELVEVTSYELTIDNENQFMQDTGLSSATIPQDDSYPLVAVRDYDPDFNYTMDTIFDKVSVLNEDDFSQSYPKWQCGIQPYNVTYEALNDIDIVLGNVTYVPSNEEIPPHGYHTIFLLDEEQGVEEQLNDSINTSGVILLKSTPTFTFQNAEDYCFPIMRLDMENETNNETIKIVKQLLENGSIVIADSTIFTNKITFVHNLSSSECLPQNDFMILYKYSDKSSNIIFKCSKLYIQNLLRQFEPQCVGIMIYDDITQDCHYMYNQYINNPRFNSIMLPAFALPGFSVNKTVGAYLDTYSGEENTISGHLYQFHHKETILHPGVIASNVEAYLNITRSPQDKVVILSSRYDAMWGECPGDSAAGNGIIMGIAKYMQDLNRSEIKPKYNVTFLLTTNEENGYFGAQFYSDSHPDDNICMWIGTDQLGYKNGELYNLYKNPTHRKIVDNITKLLDYEGNTGYGMTHELTENIILNYPPLKPFNAYKGIRNNSIFGRMGCGAEDVVFHDREDCDTILIHKGDPWDYHHRRGLNLQEGDVLNSSYFDWNDAYMFYNITWETVKYFLYTPDCRFESTSYEAVGPSEGSTATGTIPNTLKATFKVKSMLPNDLVMINATLYDASSEDLVNHTMLNYTVNREGCEQNITFTMPAGIKEGDYYVRLEVYNSTARINRIVGIDFYANDTATSPTFHLSKYRTLGDIRIGTSSATVHNIIRGSRYTPAEDAVVHNITAYVYGVSSAGPTYQYMIYRMSDGHLMGYSNQVACNSTGWVTFNFSSKPVLIQDTQYMLSIWGNNGNAIVYSTPQTQGGNGYENSSYTYGTPPQTIFWDTVLALQQYSLFCWYTPDIPYITNVTASPHMVGFGYNVTISADVIDRSGVNFVEAQLSTPGGGPGMSNYTMTHVSGDTYQYVFLNTWTVGQYNYTIWVVDNSSNENRSTGHHFHVSADATIGIATLQDIYSGDDYINITDPPNPPENLTLVAQGLTWDKYYNAVTGRNILDISTGPVNYQNDNDTWAPINTTINQLESNHPAYVYGYRTGNNRGLYGAYFKSNAQNDWPVAFTYNKSDDPSIYAVRSKILGVGYVDPASNWSYQYLQSVQSSQGQTNNNSITYPGVFTGTDVTWSYGNARLKEELTLSNATKTVIQNHPPSLYGLHNDSSYLVFITKLDYQNLHLYNASGMLSGNSTITHTRITFKDLLGHFKCALPLGEAYEVNNESVREKLTYRIIHLNGNTYLLTGLKTNTLLNMTFPVIIDPTLTIDASTSDGYIYQSDLNYTTAWTASDGTVSGDDTSLSIGQTGLNFSLDYRLNRGFLFFNTTALPTNAILTNALLSLYKKNDYSMTDFTLTVQNGQPEYPHDPLKGEDYDKEYYSGDGGSLNTTDLINGRNNITLTTLNWINAGDTTKLCLRSSRDINGTTPTGNEYITIYANEQGDDYQPRLVITYTNQSKIKNTGSTDFNGYLQIQVQYNDSGTWVLDTDPINETPPVWPPRTIKISDQLSLDTMFNGKVRASDLQHGDGMYRVYVAFKDPEGNILKTNEDVELAAWWEFTKT